MKNIYKLSFILLSAAILCFSFGISVSAQTLPQVQTNSATNISNYQATLNGYLSDTGLYYSNYVYFQWGTTTNYGHQTSQQYLNNTILFSQNIANLDPNITYHFRAVAEGNYGILYGQDMTFNSSGYSYVNGTLSISKQVINLTSGNLNWQTSVDANPSDILCFAVILQANGQTIHNATLRDILPAYLIYKGNLTINASSNYSGNIISGINIGTIHVNQPVVVTYQVQVAPQINFSYGTTTIINNAIVSSNENGTQNSRATVIVNKSSVSGASTVSTGLTNDFLKDSFFLPLLIIILALWLYLSGKIYKFADWLKMKL